MELKENNNLFEIVNEEKNFQLLAFKGNNNVEQTKSMMENLIQIVAEAMIIGCTSTKAARLTIDDVKNQARECAKLAYKDNTMLCLRDLSIDEKSNKDSNSVNNIVSIFIGLSKNNKYEFLLNLKKHNNKRIDTEIDILNFVDTDVSSLDNPIYLFMYGTKKNLHSKGYAAKLLDLSFRYLNSIGYKSLYAEATSIRSEFVLVKAGGVIKKSFYFSEYPDKEKFSFLNGKEERESHIQFDFKKILKPKF